MSETRWTAKCWFADGNEWWEICEIVEDDGERERSIARVPRRDDANKIVKALSALREAGDG